MAERGKNLRPERSRPSSSGRRCSRCSSRPAIRGSPSRIPATSAPRRTTSASSTRPTSAPRSRSTPSKDETAVCNLGSVILDTHLKPDGSIDHHKLRETIRIAVRALDNVIDINFYPTEAAQRSNMRHRPIGLGVMGLQNALYMKGVAFASPEAVEFNDEAMEAIAFYAYEASSRPRRASAAPIRPTRARSGTAACCRRTRSTCSRRSAACPSRSTARRPDGLDAPAREDRARRACATATSSPSRPPRRSRTSWAPRPASSRPTRTSSSNRTSRGEFIVLNPFLVKDLKARGLWDQEMIDNLKYFDGELKDIDRVPADLKQKYMTAFDIDSKWIARRRRAPAEMDRPVAVGEPLAQDARPQDPVAHVPRGLARRASRRHTISARSAPPTSRRPPSR